MKTRTITSGSYTFPMNSRERDRLLHSMTPDARARFYDREMEAHTRLKGLNEAEEADAAYERKKASSKPL
ncbi:hypothetical protein HDF16_003823 [Granulicella aggregans]|uniref:Uncharacterized protein n=1 Tax=Granulicella aggregans TaxID=474949 RepID=A0A7W7ZFP4_9BACT|nr:hypothetical protein [Granulicella aggregans]MBB5059100.1 hypothetical protein [Granulicella aggregans]